MDTLTQAALGATIGQAGFRSRLGGKAVVFGAVCGLIPDLDIIVRILGPWESMVHHRGVTHSVLTLPFLAFPVGWAGYRIWAREGEFRTWVHLAFWALFTHPLLDACTSYGTQLLAPFSDERFSTDAVGIIDLLYSLPLFAAVAVSRWGLPEVRSRVAWMALLCSTLYLGGGHLLSYQARLSAEDSLEELGVVVVRLRTPPPAFFSGLRRLVAVDSMGTVWASNLSVWFPHELEWVQITGERDPQITAVLDTKEGEIFSWFADGFALAERVDSQSVVIRDHRYGMFRDLSWTPFRVRASLDSNGQIQSVDIQERLDDLELGAELAEGWRQMMGD